MPGAALDARRADATLTVVPSERSDIPPIALIALAAPIGLAAAGIAVGYRAAIAELHWALTGQRTGLVDTAHHFAAWQRVLLPTVGGAIAGAFLALVARLARGDGRGDYLEAMAARDPRMGSRSTLLRGLSALFSVASGGSIGREGSMVQLSAFAASLPGLRLRLPAEQRQLLIACGAAGGLAAVYNAPLAGVLFVGEIGLGTMALERLAPLSVSAVVASFAVRLRHVAPFLGEHVYSELRPADLGACLALGAVAGFAAPAFLAALDAARRGFARTALPMPVRLAAGGLVVGVVSVAFPDVWGNGASVIDGLLGEPTPWQALAALLAAKVVATAATHGSGAVGGVFTPTLLVGAALGGLWGRGCEAVAPGFATAGNAYAVIGMACFLSGTTQAPFMAILMLFEMTFDHRLLLPLMLASVISATVSRWTGVRPVYGKPGEREAHAGEVTPASSPSR